MYKSSAIGLKNPEQLCFLYFAITQTPCNYTNIVHLSLSFQLYIYLVCSFLQAPGTWQTLFSIWGEEGGKSFGANDHGRGPIHCSKNVNQTTAKAAI